MESSKSGESARQRTKPHHSTARDSAQHIQELEEIGHWWSGLAQEREAPTPAIRAKADDLTRGASTWEEKARAIYSYVATHFRYISISLGTGRYQPHAADEVLSNEYGDCKDKHILLASLLAAAGIDAYPALINSARQIDPDVPSPGQLDHMVSTLPETARTAELVARHDD